ncbi:pentatricopeptide repeat-containing protein At5g67570, chloroplastic-like [Humulus lupulus]|uniref:pentatricopeptide repeat-containing protein At5g67570, chloroplastic-like n=1 Tax=Humulus lupulus TaxID=3486 RepID=UPI002B413586|nr:pentatricopeptide repeat-containing protein At5g67570, chloroplastic-like [Humulus lupulus]XP_062102236.1 pentatricopeptide repeat-containing protein At5g67570, chloroplastic-like [Humulus lupulus]
MKQLGLEFTKGQLLRIIEGLGPKRCSQIEMAVVEWVYEDKERGRNKSRFVYTKLMAILGKARKPDHALNVFNLMRGNRHIYPDMAAYHSIAITLVTLFLHMVDYACTPKEVQQHFQSCRTINRVTIRTTSLANQRITLMWNLSK